MENWEAYENVTMPGSAVMDQITQNAVITSARIGIEVAPGSLPDLMDWGATDQVGSAHTHAGSSAGGNAWQRKFGRF